MNTPVEIRAAVYHIVHEIALDTAPNDDQANDDLPTDTYLDSFDTFTLIQDLEATFNIDVADEEVSSDNLGSIANIVRFVQTKRTATAGQV